MLTINSIWDNKTRFDSLPPDFPCAPAFLSESTIARGKRLRVRSSTGELLTHTHTKDNEVNAENFFRRAPLNRQCAGNSQHFVNATAIIEEFLTVRSRLTPDSAKVRESILSPGSALSPKIHRLYDYLTKLSVTEEIAEDTKRLALESWQHLDDAMQGNLMVPDAASGPDGQVFYAWDENEHHLGLEIFSTGEREFFYRNRETEHLWLFEMPEGEFVVTPQIKETLALFPLT